MKRKGCQRRRPAQTLGLILLGAGLFILAVLFLPPIVWVFLAAIALICGGIAVLTKK
ncbi:MAG: hypothetical protein LBN43_04385 [Oscillospiraceae bacterium]|nr:hypothetical protein [Oscillospiraceae bacterium]